MYQDEIEDLERLLSDQDEAHTAINTAIALMRAAEEGKHLDRKAAHVRICSGG